MKNTRKPRKPVSAEAIARLADQGKDVSRFFTNTGTNDGSDPEGECGLRLGHAGRTGPRCEGVEYQPPSRDQDADTPGARPAVSGARHPPHPQAQVETQLTFPLC